jgi:hypothetical protein
MRPVIGQRRSIIVGSSGMGLGIDNLDHRSHRDHDDNRDRGDGHSGDHVGHSVGRSGGPVHRTIHRHRRSRGYQDKSGSRRAGVGTGPPRARSRTTVSGSETSFPPHSGGSAHVVVRPSEARACSIKRIVLRMSPTLVIKVSPCCNSAIGIGRSPQKRIGNQLNGSPGKSTSGARGIAISDVRGMISGAAIAPHSTVMNPRLFNITYLLPNYPFLIAAAKIRRASLTDVGTSTVSTMLAQRSRSACSS